MRGQKRQTIGTAEPIYDYFTDVERALRKWLYERDNVYRESVDRNRARTTKRCQQRKETA